MFVVQYPTVQLCLQYILQRKWAVGPNKFNGSDADIAIPMFDSEWVSFPPRKQRDVPFLPKEEHMPIGNTNDHSNEKFVGTSTQLEKKV